jgi:hypothetical protein
LGEEYRSWSSSLWSFYQLPVTLSPLGPNIQLHALFPNTLRPFPPSVTAQCITVQTADRHCSKEQLHVVVRASDFKLCRSFVRQVTNNCHSKKFMRRGAVILSTWSSRETPLVLCVL